MANVHGFAQILTALYKNRQIAYRRTRYGRQAVVIMIIVMGMVTIIIITTLLHVGLNIHVLIYKVLGDGIHYYCKHYMRYYYHEDGNVC